MQTNASLISLQSVTRSSSPRGSYIRPRTRIGDLWRPPPSISHSTRWYLLGAHVADITVHDFIKALSVSDWQYVCGH